MRFLSLLIPLLSLLQPSIPFFLSSLLSINYLLPTYSYSFLTVKQEGEGKRRQVRAREKGE